MVIFLLREKFLTRKFSGKYTEISYFNKKE